MEPRLVFPGQFVQGPFHAGAQLPGVRQQPFLHGLSFRPDPLRHEALLLRVDGLPFPVPFQQDPVQLVPDRLFFVRFQVQAFPLEAQVKERQGVLFLHGLPAGGQFLLHRRGDGRLPGGQRHLFLCLPFRQLRQQVGRQVAPVARFPQLPELVQIRQVRPPPRLLFLPFLQQQAVLFLHPPQAHLVRMGFQDLIPVDDGDFPFSLGNKGTRRTQQGQKQQHYGQPAHKVPPAALAATPAARTGPACHPRMENEASQEASPVPSYFAAPCSALATSSVMSAPP